MNFKKLFSSIVLASALIVGVGVGVAALKSSKEAEPAAAETYSFNTYQNVFLFRKYPNLGWNSSGAKTAVKFKDDYNNECWSQIVSDADIFKGGHDDAWNQDYIDYFVYPDNLNHQWTKFQLHRIDSSATSEPWNHVWNYTNTWSINSGLNCYGPSPASNNTDDIRYLSVDVNAATVAGGDTIYIRDTDGDAWTADSHYLQVHLWGNSYMKGDRYINATKVQGNYADDLSDPINHLYEAVIPNDAGRYKWFQVKRINPSTSTPTNQSNDFEVDTSKNVFEYSGTGWSGGVMSGSFKWNITNATRANYFSRYVVSETAARCTPTYYNVNTKADFATAWSNIKTQYQQMSTTNQGIFYTAVANDSTYPGKGAYRYDYLVSKYKLENFVNRSVSLRAISIFPINGTNTTANTIAIVVIFSAIAVTSIGGYFFLRHRKEN